ncbi:hypothetical protein P886_2114 [Alteromonadaceae bacterium 2753L.S.0a.02]|nr:hypothetical protein P886_2114 [Alteromonadaceae bacterium 2753L.S.0a.02]
MLYPIFALVVFTFLFMILQFFLRVKAVRNKEVRAAYFRLFETREGERTPYYLIAGQNHLANLFDTPVLFYLVGSLAIVLDVQSSLMVALAWAYVAARVVHAYIHCTYNHLLHRLVIFWVGIIVLMIMWTLLMLSR